MEKTNKSKSNNRSLNKRAVKKVKAGKNSVRDNLIRKGILKDPREVTDSEVTAPKKVATKVVATKKKQIAKKSAPKKKPIKKVEQKKAEPKKTPIKKKTAPTKKTVKPKKKKKYDRALRTDDEIRVKTKLHENQYREEEFKTLYDPIHNTYDGIEIVWANIQQFQILFLEAQYLLTEAEYEKKIFHKEDFPNKLKRNKAVADNERKRLRAIEQLEETYKIVWSIRRQVYNLYKNSEAARNEIDKQCKEDVVLWINTFAWTFDPRLASVGLPSKLPFVLYPAQVDVIRKVDECFLNRKKFLIEKSRAEGLTEMLCAYDVWRFLYTPGYKAGWGSRVKTLVDSIGNQDTIFEKLRRIIYALPKEMRPLGWKNPLNNKYDNSMRLVNPQNGASIIGEGGKNIGRGGRSSFYKVDEAAMLEYPRAADSALSANTNVQGDISTPNGTNYFYEKKMSGRVEVITVWWWRNPSKNKEWAADKVPKFSAWYKDQELTLDPVVLAQEINIDYLASVGGSMIPSEWVNAAVDLELPYKGERVAGYDLAAGGEDKATYVLREGVKTLLLEEVYAKTPMDGTWIVIDKCERDRVELLCYDKNTLGEDVYPQIKNSERRVTFKLEGIYGQGTPSERFLESEGVRATEKFRNRRAELWWNLRKRFEKTFLHTTGVRFFPTNELISIPHHSELIAELSAPRIMHTTQGKIGVESKSEMKRRKVKSPNWADALAYSYSGSEEDAQVIGTFDYSEDNIVSEFKYNPNSANNLYISAYLTEDQQLYVLVNSFNLQDQRLDIIAEKLFEYIDVESVYEFVEKTVGEIGLESLKDWYGNDKMFEGITKGKRTIWYDFRKVGITFKQNYRQDYNASLVIMNKMFKNGKLRITDVCDGTINQVRNWKIAKGKPKKGFYFCEALAQLVLMLRRINIVQNQPEKPLRSFRGYR